MNEILFICICLLKVELLWNHFSNHCSHIIVPHCVGHLLLLINIFEKCDSICSLMILISKLHFHAKSIRYFSNGRCKLVTFWMIIQWKRNNWHNKSFRVRTTNTIIKFLEKNYIELRLFFLTYSISWQIIIYSLEN